MASSGTRNGFTLIELSIVLVIVGLIVGGVLVGRDLIDASHRQKLISTVDSYKVAVQTFRSKYNCLPGDCANATSFLGVSSAGCVEANNTGNINYTAGNVSGTCNGNGNGRLSFYVNYEAPNEAFIFWQHLSLANMVNARFKGMGTDSSYLGYYSSFPGYNVPALSFNPSIGFNVEWQNPANEGDNPSMYYFWGSYYLGSQRRIYRDHLFIVGRDRTSGGTVTSGAAANSAAFSPQFVYTIDTKIDDGLPYSGYVQAHRGGSYGGECTLAYTRYDTQKTSVDCAVEFTKIF